MAIAERAALLSPSVASVAAAALDLLVQRAKEPALLGGVFVAAAFVGAGFVLAKIGRASDRAATIAIALGAALYAALTVLWMTSVASPRVPLGGAASAALLSAAIAAAACAAGLRTGRRRAD